MRSSENARTVTAGKLGVESLAQLDRPTLQVVLVLVALCSVLVTASIWRVNRTIAGPVWWLIASLFLLGTFVAVPLGALFGLPLEVSVAANNAAALFALFAMLEGALQFRGYRYPWRWLGGFAFALVLASFSFVNRFDAAARYLVFDAAAVVILVAVAIVAVWKAPRSERAGLWMLAGFALVEAAAFASRWYLALTAGPEVDVLEHSLQNGFYLLVIVYLIGWAYSIGLVCYQRATSTIEAVTLQDELTGLANRRSFDRALLSTVTHARAGDAPFLMVMLDLNTMKAVNDRWGHPAGDAVLIETGRRLRACAGSDDFVARVGGDEFTIIIRGSRREIEARLACVRSRLDGLVSWRGESIPLECSIGVARWGVDATDLGSLVQIADARMYADKADSRRESQLQAVDPESANEPLPTNSARTKFHE